ncbi:MAG TPA: cbb3-type cytochrome c oxidase subunit I, partial [Methylotenera sp.]|nr:cbb3-type cytochrome c oxidase subunit I [Methylotenera sp.]
KTVNALSHYTDWTIGHVHAGALGWVGMISIGAIYHMVEKLWNTKMYSARLLNIHFWMATIGTAIYITAMWISGIMQGLMWRAYDDHANLAYTFVESVVQMHPYYAMRAIGGFIFFSGACLMLWHVLKTIHLANREFTSSTTARASTY